MEKRMDIWCCGCNATVSARLTDGREIYRSRADLHSLPFWRCDSCRNYVGCHHKTKNRTAPLGCIPTAAIKDTRQKIHRIIDPVWRSKTMTRRQVYDRIAAAIGQDEYHTAEIRTLEQAYAVHAAAQALADEYTCMVL